MQPAQLLTRRFLSLGAINPIDFLEKFMPAIRSWLIDVVRENAPSKDEVLEWVGDALDEVLESTEFPFADDLLDAAIKKAIIQLAGMLFDRIISDQLAV